MVLGATYFDNFSVNNLNFGRYDLFFWKDPGRCLACPVFSVSFFSGPLTGAQRRVLLDHCHWSFVYWSHFRDQNVNVHWSHTKR